MVFNKDLFFSLVKNVTVSIRATKQPISFESTHDNRPLQASQLSFFGIFLENLAWQIALNAWGTFAIEDLKTPVSKGVNVIIPFRDNGIRKFSVY